MKLFLWDHNIYVLMQWACGTAFALADTLEEAIELIVTEFAKQKVEEFEWFLKSQASSSFSKEEFEEEKAERFESMKEEIAQLRKELNESEHSEYEQQFAHIIYGSA